MASQFRKKYTTTSILLTFKVHENMNFTTQQLRSDALTFWEFQSLESDKSFCECPGIFLT